MLTLDPSQKWQWLD